MKLFSCLFSRTLLFVLLPIFSFATTTITADHTVLVSNYSFTPAELTISPGETVAFINVEGLHNVNGVTNTLSGESFNNPEEFFLPEVEGTAAGVLIGEITFDQPGTYNYDCSIGFHAQLGMVGTIVVDAYTISDLLVANLIPETNLSWVPFTSYLDPLLNGPGPLTLFLPNRSAVDEVLELMNLNAFDLLAFQDMSAICEYHVATGLWLAEDLEAGMNLPTVYGQDLIISETDGVLQVDGASIIDTNYITDNGVVHVINKCLAPSDLPNATVWDLIKDSDDHQLLEEAIIRSEYVDLLRAQNDLDPSLDLPGPFTVFAPTDAAFEAYSQELGITTAELVAGQFIDDIVRVHIIGSKVESDDFFDGQQLQSYFDETQQTNQITINSDTVFVEGTPIQRADLQAYNGVVHVIEEIILDADELPVLEGTCGTWTLVLEEEPGYYSEGWEGIFVDVQIDGEVISKESGFVNTNPSRFEFGVDEGAVIDLVVNNDPDVNSGGTIPFVTPALKYELYNSNNELVYDSREDQLMSSIYGLTACGAPLSCGVVEIQMFDDYIDGWDIGRLNVSINDDFYRTIPFVAGNFQRAYIPTNNGDVVDFNYVPGFFSNESSYVIYNPEGLLIAAQATPGEAPESVVGLLICEATTSVSNQSANLSTSIFPNPTSDKLYIKSDIEILGVSIINAYGQRIYGNPDSQTVLDVSNLQVGTYILEVRTVERAEFHKFSIVQ